MYVLLADYNIFLEYTYDGGHNTIYRLKKYYDLASNTYKICVEDNSKANDGKYNGLLSRHPNHHLLETITLLDTLFDIEVVCVDDGPKNPMYEFKKCDKISVYDFINCNSFCLIPSKYKEDKEKYIKNTFYFPSKKLTFQQYDMLKRVKESKTVKSFLDEFNSISIDSKYCEITHCCCNREIDEMKNNINDLYKTVQSTKNSEGLLNDTEDNINVDNICTQYELYKYGFTNLKGRNQTQKKIIDNYIKLTHNNLLEEALSYYNENDIDTLDVVEVIKLMLSSKEYVLSDDFKKNKLDLKDIQFKFKMLTSPETITKEEILAEVFDIDNSVSLI